MEFISTNLPEVILIRPTVFRDSRGFFLETYQKKLFDQAGVKVNFVQDNHSGSRQGIIRGLHYQLKKPQGKLVRAVAGEIFDVAVDIRRNSPTFGMWTSAFLSDENKCQLWIPPGFAHGFLALSSWVEVVYKATDYYDPTSERTLLWNDAQIGIKWPEIPGVSPILSPKDANGTLTIDADVYE